MLVGKRCLLFFTSLGHSRKISLSCRRNSRVEPDRDEASRCANRGIASLWCCRRRCDFCNQFDTCTCGRDCRTLQERERRQESVGFLICSARSGNCLIFDDGAGDSLRGYCFMWETDHSQCRRDGGSSRPRFRGHRPQRSRAVTGDAFSRRGWDSLREIRGNEQ